MECPICKGTFNSTEELETLTKGNERLNEELIPNDQQALLYDKGFADGKETENTSLTEENESLKDEVKRLDDGRQQTNVINLGNISAYIKENTALTEKVEVLRLAAQDFIDKVDCGMARSVDSYAKFKQAIAATEKE